MTFCQVKTNGHRWVEEQVLEFQAEEMLCPKNGQMYEQPECVSKTKRKINNEGIRMWWGKPVCAGRDIFCIHKMEPVCYSFIHSKNIY